MKGYWHPSTTLAPKMPQRVQLTRLGNADPTAKIFMAKWDIKDGFWHMDCKESKEWNFAYVLPQPKGEPVKLVVPTLLQMKWVESPPKFSRKTKRALSCASQTIPPPS